MFFRKEKDKDKERYPVGLTPSFDLLKSQYHFDAKLYECELCGNEYLNNESVNYNGKNYCSHCFQNNF